MKALFKLCLLGVLVAVVLVGGCVREEKILSRPQIEPTSLEKTFDVYLRINDVPVKEGEIIGADLEDNIRIELEVISYKVNISDLTAEILLSKGLKYINGNLVWNGNLIEGNSKKINATVIVVKEGVWEIKGKVKGSVTDKKGRVSQINITRKISIQIPNSAVSAPTQVSGDNISENVSEAFER